MEVSYSSSKLQSYSNALNFPVCGCVYEIQPLNLVEMDIADDEPEYFNARSCRPQQFKSNFCEDDQSDTESDSSTVLSVSDAMHAAEMHEELDEELETSSIEVSKPLESRDEGVFSIIINEEMLCVSRKNKIDSFECKGTMALTYKQKEGSHSNNDTASTVLILKDEKNVLCEVKGNPVFILSPIEPKGETRKIKIENILVQNSGKLFPIMKYSTISDYQPQYFKARSKLITQIPNSKLLVQIILNPLFHHLFESPQNFQIQALLSCFNFDEKSEIKIRSCDNFNVNTKIVTWVESLHDIKKETIISLEAVIQGVEYSKEEFKSTAPESVPLILKTVFSHTPLSNVKMFLQVENSFDNDDDNNNPPVNDEIQSNYVTQLSKVEFRFF